MGTVDDYLADLADSDRAVVQHLYDVARSVAPAAEQGRKYAMPCLVYAGKGLISVMHTRKHLAIYPFSGTVLPELAAELAGFDRTEGTLRFQADAPPSDALVRSIVDLRRAQIDGR